MNLVCRTVLDLPYIVPNIFFTAPVILVRLCVFNFGMFMMTSASRTGFIISSCFITFPSLKETWEKLLSRFKVTPSMFPRYERPQISYNFSRSFLVCFTATPGLSAIVIFIGWFAVFFMISIMLSKTYGPKYRSSFCHYTSRHQKLSGKDNFTG